MWIYNLLPSISSQCSVMWLLKTCDQTKSGKRLNVYCYFNLVEDRINLTDTQQRYSVTSSVCHVDRGAVFLRVYQLILFFSGSSLEWKRGFTGKWKWYITASVFFCCCFFFRTVILVSLRIFSPMIWNLSKDRQLLPRGCFTGYHLPLLRRRKGERQSQLFYYPWFSSRVNLI